MAASIFFFLCFIFFNLSSVYSNTDTIQSTCKSTKYYDLCFTSLNSNPTSSTADPRGLASILATSASANATSSAAFFRNNTSNDVILRKALRDCADKYKSAGSALTEAAGNLQTEEDVEEGYDYANMNVMAAADYARGCRSGFRRVKGLVYTAEMGRREDGLRRLCDVISGIIDHIGFQKRKN